MRNDALPDGDGQRGITLLPALHLPEGYFDGELFEVVADALWHEVVAAVRVVAAGMPRSAPSRGVHQVGRLAGRPAGIIAVRSGDTVSVWHYPDSGVEQEIVRLDCSEYRERTE